MAVKLHFPSCIETPTELFQTKRFQSIAPEEGDDVTSYYWFEGNYGESTIINDPEPEGVFNSNRKYLTLEGQIASNEVEKYSQYYEVDDKGVAALKNGTLPTYHQDLIYTPTAAGHRRNGPVAFATDGAIVVSGDANFVAENIKKDVEIWGVTGNYSAGLISRPIVMTLGENTTSIQQLLSDNSFTDSYISFSLTPFSNVKVEGGGNISNVQHSFYGNILVTDVELDLNITAADLAGMFGGCVNLETLTFSEDMVMPNVINLYQTFLNCSSLKELNLSALTGTFSGSSGCQDAFAGCTNLETIDLSGADFSALTSYWNMFGGCTSLTTVLVKDAGSKTVIDAALGLAGLPITSTIKGV